MASKKTFLFALALLLITVVAVLSLFARWQRTQRDARFSAEVPATIVNIDFTDYRIANASRERVDTVVDEDAGKRRRTTHVTYRYIVDNKTIEAQKLERGDKRADYRIGMNAKACYDPRYPHESKLVAEDERCGR